jgi:hypothetical protein
MDLSIVCEILQKIWSKPSTESKEGVLTQINIYLSQPKESSTVNFTPERGGANK